MKYEFGDIVIHKLTGEEMMVIKSSLMCKDFIQVRLKNYETVGVYPYEIEPKNK